MGYAWNWRLQEILAFLEFTQIAYEEGIRQRRYQAEEMRRLRARRGQPGSMSDDDG